MERKLMEIWDVRPLQDKVISYRKSLPLYERALKEVHNTEIKKLMKFEINIDQKSNQPNALKIPMLDEMKNDEKLEEPSKSIDAVSNDFSKMQQALKLIYDRHFI